MTVFGALGDIHGAFEVTRRIMERHPEVPFWLCVGDVADADGNYAPLPAPLYWIKGNNENFDVIERCTAGLYAPPYIDTYIPNGHLIEIDGLRVAGLGGTLAPTMYDVPAAELPPPRRRHFVREEVARCKAMAAVDVFLSHEAPRPFRVHGGMDRGKTPINEVLAAMTPRLHLFGHHHTFSATELNGVPTICLDLVSRSYLLIERLTFEYRQLLVK
jgi:predicted phosphodiesterase